MDLEFRPDGANCANADMGIKIMCRKTVNVRANHPSSQPDF
jgi:hypothetical protein